ncbi:MAG: fluoride efflux transporter CrcB [Bacillota bacterium]|nr:fluoride efflux transporter CrcB [Bacillota bacterium]
MGYLFVGLGGIVGALLRFLIGIIMVERWTHSFPLATLLINLIGCFFLGWLTYYVFQLKVLPSHITVAIGTGFVGAFTTFSTFSVETVQLMTAAKWGVAFSYIFISLFGGLIFAGLGYRIGSFAFIKHQKSFEGKSGEK